MTFPTKNEQEIVVKISRPGCVSFEWGTNPQTALIYLERSYRWKTKPTMVYLNGCTFIYQKQTASQNAFFIQTGEICLFSKKGQKPELNLFFNAYARAQTIVMEESRNYQMEATNKQSQKEINYQKLVVELSNGQRFADIPYVLRYLVRLYPVLNDPIADRYPIETLVNILHFNGYNGLPTKTQDSLEIKARIMIKQCLDPIFLQREIPYLLYLQLLEINAAYIELKESENAKTIGQLYLPQAVNE